jgi:hypothetical protein
MAGENVPLVMLPRYSTFAGVTVAAPYEGFKTVAMDVSDYQKAVLNVWRGRLVPDTTFAVTAEESTDQVTWSTCSGTNCSAFDPGQDTEAQVSATLKKRWFRVRVRLQITAGSPFPQASCWAVGFLEQRKI